MKYFSLLSRYLLCGVIAFSLQVVQPQDVPPVGDALPAPEVVAPQVPAAGPEVSAPPAAAPAQTPVDGVSAPAPTVPAATPPATADKPAVPAAPAGEVKSEQLKWPETVEFDEEKKPLLVAQDKQAVKNLFAQAEKINEQIEQVVNACAKMRGECERKYENIDAMLDSFYQSYATDKGRIEQLFATK